MKILFALDRYMASSGGADRLAHAVVATLTRAGHELVVLQARGNRGDEMIARVRVITMPLPKPKIIRDGDLTTLRWNILWGESIRSAIKDIQPEMIITQNMLAPASVLAGRQAGIKTVILFHGYRCISPTFFAGEDALTAPAPAFQNMPISVKLKWPLVRKALELYDAAYRAADLVVANSYYIARVIHRFFERESPVLYPVIDHQGISAASDSNGISNNDGPILFVKPQRIKGVDVVLEVAERMPERQFMIVGSAGKSLQRRFARGPNISYHSWTDDMGSVYRQSSLLLGPSQIPEPFGRVFLEAGLHGVPSVASRTGGIPEVVGQGGVLVEPDAPAGHWVETITEALQPQTYPALSTAARQQAEEILAEHNDARLLGILGI